MGQGIRTGSNQVIPITGPGGLPKSGGSLRFTHWKGSQTSLSKFRFHSSRRSDRNPSSTSPTPSYSSSEGGSAIYATIGSLHHHQHHHHSHFPAPTTTPPPPPSNITHRISAPPLSDNNSTLPRYSDHRRVKSISDIESAAAAATTTIPCTE